MVGLLTPPIDFHPKRKSTHIQAVNIVARVEFPAIDTNTRTSK